MRLGKLLLPIAAALLLLGRLDASAQTTPAGEVTVSFHVTLAPSWFDPSTAPPQVTPFGVLYALHDALVRPLPGQKMGNALAESWTESPDGLTYEFKLRRGLKFHMMFAPIMDLRGLMGVGPRLADHTINTVPMFPFPAYEDMRLKSP